MDMRIERHLELAIGRGGVIRRRDFLRGMSAAVLAAGPISWRDVVAMEADELRRQGKACILLWMQGGPSQFETFSPKPGHPNGGTTKAIATTVPGIEVSENFPRVAEQAKHLAIIRSMTSKEGSHPRATYLLHTGYLPTASVKYPAFGSIAAKELEQANFDLPSFVRIGNVQYGSSGGLLGSHYDPFVMPVAGKIPANSKPTTADARFDRRLDLLSRLESDYAAQAPAEVADHQKLYSQAQRMVHSPKMAAFDLSSESQAVRDAYGTSPFALGCLLSRRLVETGVPFVEVVADGWDTHFDNFVTTKNLSPRSISRLPRCLADLAARGMLDKTLVVWMGEFGRTPHINARDGRDHYPTAFNVVLAGGACGAVR